jgi:hypothetical protein
MVRIRFFDGKNIVQVVKEIFVRRIDDYVTARGYSTGVVDICV